MGVTDEDLAAPWTGGLDLPGGVDTARLVELPAPVTKERTASSDSSEMVASHGRRISGTSGIALRNHRQLGSGASRGDVIGSLLADADYKPRAAHMPVPVLLDGGSSPGSSVHAVDVLTDLVSVGARRASFASRSTASRSTGVHSFDSPGSAPRQQDVAPLIRTPESATRQHHETLPAPVQAQGQVHPRFLSRSRSLAVGGQDSLQHQVQQHWLEMRGAEGSVAEPQGLRRSRPSPSSEPTFTYDARASGSPPAPSVAIASQWAAATSLSKQNFNARSFAVKRGRLSI